MCIVYVGVDHHTMEGATKDMLIKNLSNYFLIDYFSKGVNVEGKFKLPLYIGFKYINILCFKT